MSRTCGSECRPSLACPETVAGFSHEESQVVAMSPPLRSTTTRRETITARCAELTQERDDLDPTGCAYEAKSLQLDAALSALFALGPVDV